MQPAILYQCKQIIDKVDVKNREDVQQLLNQLTEFQQWVEQKKQCLVQSHQFEYGEFVTEEEPEQQTEESVDEQPA